MEASKIEIAEALIIKCFEDLEKEGYERICTIPDDDTVLESIDVIYKSEKKRRKITVSFTHRILDNNEIFGFTLSIIRLPYTDAEDFFSLNTYLKNIGIQIETNMLNYFNEGEANKIIREIAIASKRSCSKIISGEEWLTVYYPKWN